MRMLCAIGCSSDNVVHGSVRDSDILYSATDDDDGSLLHKGYHALLRFPSRCLGFCVLIWWMDEWMDVCILSLVSRDYDYVARNTL